MCYMVLLHLTIIVIRLPDPFIPEGRIHPSDPSDPSDPSLLQKQAFHLVFPFHHEIKPFTFCIILFPPPVRRNSFCDKNCFRWRCYFYMIRITKKSNKHTIAKNTLPSYCQPVWLYTKLVGMFSALLRFKIARTSIMSLFISQSKRKVTSCHEDEHLVAQLICYRQTMRAINVSTWYLIWIPYKNLYRSFAPAF